MGDALVLGGDVRGFGGCVLRPVEEAMACASAVIARSPAAARLGSCSGMGRGGCSSTKAGTPPSRPGLGLGHRTTRSLMPPGTIRYEGLSVFAGPGRDLPAGGDSAEERNGARQAGRG